MTLDAPAGSPFELVTGAGGRSVGPGGHIRAGVRFAPASAGVHAAELVISSNDPDSSELRVPISGRALNGDTVEPVLVVSSEALDFGTVPNGGEATRSLSLRNQGSAPLEITSLSIAGGDVSSFEIVHGGEPGTLEADVTRWVAVAFRPGSSRAHTATLKIESNDSEQGTVAVRACLPPFFVSHSRSGRYRGGESR